MTAAINADEYDDETPEEVTQLGEHTRGSIPRTERDWKRWHKKNCPNRIQW